VEAAVFLAVEAEKALVRRIGFETSGQAEQQVEAGGLKSRREKAGPLFHVVIFRYLFIAIATLVVAFALFVNGFSKRRDNL
jgi:hypothetical protein